MRTLACNTPQHFLPARPKHTIAYYACFVVLLAVQASVAWLAADDPFVRRRGAALFALHGPGWLAMLLLGMAVLLPLAEEIVFRGFLMNFFRLYGLAAAVAGSALIFAALHFAPVLMPYLFVLGMYLAWLNVFHQTLFAPLLAHMALNAAVVVLAWRDDAPASQFAVINTVHPPKQASP